MGGTERPRCECRKIAMICWGFLLVGISFGRILLAQPICRCPSANRPDAARLDSMAWRNVKNEG